MLSHDFTFILTTVQLISQANRTCGDTRRHASAAVTLKDALSIGQFLAFCRMLCFFVCVKTKIKKRSFRQQTKRLNKRQNAKNWPIDNASFTVETFSKVLKTYFGMAKRAIPPRRENYGSRLLISKKMKLFHFRTFFTTFLQTKTENNGKISIFC